MASPPARLAAFPQAFEVPFELDVTLLPGHICFLAVTSNLALNNSHQLPDKNKENPINMQE